MKIYLAGPFFSEEQITLIQSVEHALQANPTVTEFHSPRLDQTGEYEEFTPEWARATYLKDMHHIETADCIVALLDYEHEITDPGTAYEIGIATMLKIPVIGLLTKGDTVNIMLTESLHAFTRQVSDLQSYDFTKLPPLLIKESTFNFYTNLQYHKNSAVASATAFFQQSSAK